MSTTNGVVEATKTTAPAIKSANDILVSYLEKALEKTGNVIDKSVDIVMEQAPLLVKEVLTWYFAYNLILFIASIVSFIVIAIGFRKFIKYVEANSIDSFAYFPATLISGLLIIISAFMFNLQWLKIYLAPRLWLIEYTASLVKAVSH